MNEKPVSIEYTEKMVHESVSLIAKITFYHHRTPIKCLKEFDFLSYSFKDVTNHNIFKVSSLFNNLALIFKKLTTFQNERFCIFFLLSIKMKRV